MKRKDAIPVIHKRSSHKKGQEMKTKIRQATCIVVVPGGRPELAYDDAWDVAEKRIDSTISGCRYPQQYGRSDTLRLLLDDNGIYRPTAYNSWGIVGPFEIYRLSTNGRQLAFTQSLVREVLEDLSDVDGGMLNPKSGTACPFVEPFARYGIPPAGWVPPAGKWFRD